MSARKRRRNEGTASVEIVVMLPMFILLLAGMFYAHGTALALLTARANARGCAYQFAMDACAHAEHDVDLCAEASAASGEDIDTGDTGDARSILDQIREIPILGTAVEALFGEVAAAHASVESPGLAGAEPETHVGNLYLVCNTEPKSWDGIAGFLCSLADTALSGLKVPGC